MLSLKEKFKEDFDVNVILSETNEQYKAQKVLLEAKDLNSQLINNPSPNLKSNDKDDNIIAHNKDGNLFTLKAEQPENILMETVKQNEINLKKNKKGCCLIL